MYGCWAYSNDPHMFFNVHQSHRQDSKHPTPVFFTKSGTTGIYVECSTAGQSHISHLQSNASRTATHACIYWDHDFLTSVIKHKTFAPCYTYTQGMYPYIHMDVYLHIHLMHTHT